MSKEIRDTSELHLTYQELLTNTAAHIGKTVILGAYVIEVNNLEESTLITALQAPLGFRDEPKQKDLSEGRLVVAVDRFIDPEIFQKERKFTIGGIVTGGSSVDLEGLSYPFVKIKAMEIYLWPKENKYPRYYNYYYDDCWPDGFSRRPYRPCW